MGQSVAFCSSLLPYVIYIIDGGGGVASVVFKIEGWHLAPDGLVVFVKKFKKKVKKVKKKQKTKNCGLHKIK